MPPQASPFWLCHECGAQMRPIMVDGVPHCASCNSDFLEILDEEVNPDPFHELPHPPTRPGADYGPPPVPPRPAAPLNEEQGGILSQLFSSVLGRLGGSDESRSGNGDSSSDPNGPPDVPRRPVDSSPSASRGPRTRTYNWGNATFTFTTGGADLFYPPGPQGGGHAHADPGLDAYFRGFGAPATPQRTGTRAMMPEEASGAIFLQALMDMLAEDGATGVPGRGRFGDYVVTDDGYNDILERLMQAAGPQGPLPATDAIIAGLPRIAFDAKTLAESQFKDCPICMEDFDITDIVIRISCKHIFHPDCLIPWLKSNGSCPVCRFSLVSQSESATSDVPSRSETPGPHGEAHTNESTSGDDERREGERSHLAAAGDFLSSTLSTTLLRLFGQSGAASSGDSGAATPTSRPDTDRPTPEAASNLPRATHEQFPSDTQSHTPLPEEYHPGVFPGHHPDLPEEPPRRPFVRRLSTLSNSFVPTDTLPSDDAVDFSDPNDDPPDGNLADLDPPDERVGSLPRTGFNPGNISGISSGIPADYRAMHARRERQQEQERLERERQRAADNGFDPRWHDVD